MLVISYSSSQGYLNMVNRLNRICSCWNIPFYGYTRSWLETTKFYSENRNVLDISKGNGLWAWKPFIILDAFNKDEEVIYLDSSVVPSSKEEIYRIMSETDGLSASPVPFIHTEWTKRDCFREMGCDEERYWNTRHVWAGVVTARSRASEIVKEWLDNCRNYKAISDDLSLDNFPNFMEHRHDQSILSNILQKHDQFLFDTEGNFADVVDYEAK